MKIVIRRVKMPSRFLLLLLAALCLGALPARAGLSIDVHLYHDNYEYFCFPLLSTNTATTNDTSDTYFVSSGPGNVHGELDAGSTFSQAGSGYFGDLPSLAAELTNAPWTLLITNNTSTNQYSFTVRMTGVSSNIFSPVLVTFPTNGAIGITNLPLFAWTGPTNWAGTLNVNDNFIDANGNNNGEASTYLAARQTNWLSPVTLPNGTNDFNVDYEDNSTALVVANIPTNSHAQQLAGWVSTSTLESYYDSQFEVGLPVVITGTTTGGHTLIAHYTFDNSSYLGQDSSPEQNNLDCESYWGNPQQEFSSDSKAGAGAVQFFGVSSLTPCAQSFTDWTNALAGSFSVSLWINTTAIVGNDNDDLNDYTGQSVIYADSNGEGTDPVGITGTKAAFYTGDQNGNDDTLHSTNDVTTGQYVHIVVTRNQTTGQKIIYINGSFDSADMGSTAPLTGETYASIGGEVSSSYSGLIDDVQIYSGVLNASEVTNLFENPGTTAPNVTGILANGLVVHYDFDEGTVVAPDVSGNGNNMVLAGNFGGAGPTISSQAIAGAGSVSFDGGSFLTPPAALLSTLAGSFTVSLWVNTTQSVGNQGDYAFGGAGILSADVPSLTNDLVPVALTGGQVAFNTGNVQGGYDDTINSAATVNDGAWHHVVVCRNQPTGEKDIYIDGVLDTYDFDTTNLLNAPVVLTMGALADASNPDPTSPTYTGYNGYQGLLDDVQIYDRPLSPNEIAYLYDNPGLPLPNATTNAPYPVDVSLQLTIQRSQDPYFGQYYTAGVSFNSVSPAPTTTNSVQSPNNYYSTEQSPASGSGTSTLSSSLDEVINECTNGLWKIYINQSSPTQQVYSFQVAITGLTTNLLQAVQVFSPTNGAMNVATNPVFFWHGPTNFSTLQVELLYGPVAFPPVTATNWPSAPTVPYGPNRFDVDYNSNNFPGITFSTPVDSSSNAINSWSTTVVLNTESFNPFVVGPNPVQLTNTMTTSTNVTFAFQSQSGVTNNVQYRTNLVLGSWQTYTNISGNGAVDSITIPRSVFNGSLQGYFRISSQ